MQLRIADDTNRRISAAERNFRLVVLGNRVQRQTVPEASVRVSVNGSNDPDGTWIARPATTAGGAFELRLRLRATDPIARTVSVAGSLTGVVTDTQSFNLTQFPAELSSASGTVEMVGEVHQSRSTPPFVNVFGTTSAPLPFSIEGVTVTCPGATWSISGPLNAQ